ncbi:hypothetical protein DFA_03617 [Cavenderia fasciculata]|uniref:Uncharacterized protein n=1 Tax=Cavenderia fasciculata TaxID=261658 RepID=F4PID9_CACFS|nr:uncharacterized protein DFA_03617 [Cavenderia fasciculata]EGG25368.1 hypothetical protein DFA_03617 [Cavenderia fasciculata]|eukprot:XP_004363219.1 hypothetical protein DFA_03617 [Cavenderia fasciculata]
MSPKLIEMKSLKQLYSIESEGIHLKYDEKEHGQRRLLCIDFDNLICSLDTEYQLRQQRLIRSNQINVVSTLQFREFMETSLRKLLETGFKLVFFSDGVESEEKANSTKVERFGTRAKNYKSFGERIWDPTKKISSYSSKPSNILAYEEVYHILLHLIDQGHPIEWSLCKKEGDLELIQYAHKYKEILYGILSNDNDFFFANVGSDCTLVTTGDLGFNLEHGFRKFIPYNFKTTCQRLNFKHNSLLVILFVLIHTELGAKDKSLDYFIKLTNTLFPVEDEEWLTSSDNVDTIVERITDAYKLNEFRQTVCKELYLSSQPKILANVHQDWSLTEFNGIFSKFINPRKLISSTLFRPSLVSINIDHNELVHWRDDSSQYITYLTAPVRTNIYSMFCSKPVTERLIDFNAKDLVQTIQRDLVKVPITALESYQNESIDTITRLKTFYQMANVQWPDNQFGDEMTPELKSIPVWHHFVIASWLFILKCKDWKIVDEDEFDCFLLHSLFLRYGLGKTILTSAPQSPNSNHVEYFKGTIDRYNCHQYQIYVFFNLMLLNCYQISACLNLDPDQTRPAPSQFSDGDLYQLLSKSVTINIYNPKNVKDYKPTPNQNNNNVIGIDNRLFTKYQSIIQSNKPLMNDFKLIKSIIKPSLPQYK